MWPHGRLLTLANLQQKPPTATFVHLLCHFLCYLCLSTPRVPSCGLMDNPDPRQFATETPNRHLCTPSMPFPVLSTPFYASCALMWPRGRLRPSPICNINPQPPPLYTYAISCAIYAFLRLVCPHVASWTTQTLANLQQKPNALGSNCVHPASYLSSGLSVLRFIFETRSKYKSCEYRQILYITLQFYTPLHQNCLQMNFDEYSSPSPHLLFSADFFSKLVFGKAAELQYPTIAPPGSVYHQNFSIEEPLGATSTLMSSHDVIPSVLDLLPTTSGMKDAYIMGMRSVSVEFCVGMVQYSYCYHFAKVRSYDLAFVDMCSIPIYYRLDSSS